MADFVESANARSAIRTLANPIADVTTFNMVRVEDPKQEKSSSIEISKKRIIRKSVEKEVFPQGFYPT